MLKRLRMMVPVVVVIAIAIAGKWVLFPGQPFDQTAWKNAGPNDYVRNRMADRMIAHRTLIGKTRDEITELFGQPDRDLQEGTMSYCLGPERGFISIDSEWLAVHFNTSGQVDRCWLWND